MHCFSVFLTLQLFGLNSTILVSSHSINLSFTPNHTIPYNAIPYPYQTIQSQTRGSIYTPICAIIKLQNFLFYLQSIFQPYSQTPIQTQVNWSLKLSSQNFKTISQLSNFQAIRLAAKTRITSLILGKVMPKMLITFQSMHK